MQKVTSEFNIVNGIHRIKIDVPFEVGFVCVYLIQLDDTNLLFDAGLNISYWKKEFSSLLSKINIKISDIDYLFISHNHLDHIGLSNYLKRRNPDLQILMHDITSKELKWETNAQNYEKIEKKASKVSETLLQFGMTEKQSRKLIEYFTKWPKLKKYVQPDKILFDDDSLKLKNNKLRIIWTPGHALGHICLFNEEQKYLFSGDHILSRITPHIGNYIINPEIEEEYSNFDFENVLKLYLNSLNRIEALKPKIIFPAHQEIIYNPIARIQEIREHHRKRIKEITNLISNKPKTPFEIAKKHFGDLDDINTFLAVSEVLGHLIYLENEGKVTKVEKDSMIFYLTDT